MTTEADLRRAGYPPAISPDRHEAAIAVAEAACELVEKVGDKLRLKSNIPLVDFNAAMFKRLAQACIDYAPYREK